MEETKKHLDELVATQAQKRDKLRAIGREIASSATPIVVAFVDLAESTQMKQGREPEEWPGSSWNSSSALISWQEWPTVRWSSGSVMSSWSR